MEILTLQLNEIKKPDLSKYVKVLESTDFWPSSLYLKRLFKPYKDEEEVVMIYCKLCCQVSQYTHYMNNMHVIVESNNLSITNQTTGLSTWSGSSFMLDFIQTLDIKEYTIIELGCGTGLLGIGCLNLASKVIFTDYNAEVLKNCASNIVLNKNSVKNENYQIGILDFTLLNCLEDCFFKLDSSPNMVVMADICYDQSVISDLVNTINIFTSHEIPVYMGFTLRNQETFELFVQASKAVIISRFTPKQQVDLNEICREFVVLTFRSEYSN